MTGYNSTDYCQVQDLKAQLRIPDGDTIDDAALQVAITAASRAIDLACDRQFGVTGSAVDRFYAYGGLYIEGRLALAVTDLMTTVGLAVNIDTTGNGTYIQTLVNATDFDLYPWNAAVDGKPWTHLVIRPYGTAWYFPAWAKSVKVTGNFGWTAVPVVVEQACLIQAARFFTRRDSAYGVAGSPELGSQIRLLSQLDPDVALMLASVKRHWGAAGV